MVGNKPVKDLVIAQIVALYKQDVLTKDIANTVGVSKCTVQRWIKRFKKGGENEVFQHSHLPGRPRKLNPANKKNVKLLLEKKPRTTSHQLKEENDNVFKGVSARTLRRTIHDQLGYLCLSRQAETSPDEASQKEPPCLC